MMFLKEHHRPMEAIVADLQSELRPVKEESLLIHAMRMILELDFRSTSPLYQYLQSPMRQTLYLVDVFTPLLTGKSRLRWTINAGIG